MGQKIGYQHGIKSFFDWYRKQPGVPQRGPGYDPDDINTWPWPDKMERTMNILAADHDAAVVGPDPGPVPPDPEPEPGPRYAPRTHNTVGTVDARFCCKPEYGVTLIPGGHGGDKYVDEMGIHYSDGGMDLGGRSKDQVPGLKGANSMDGMEPCDPYTLDGRTFPPYPAESFNR